MRFGMQLVGVVGTIAVCAHFADAKTIKVAKGGPVPTIQAGVDAAGAGDTVLIAAGTYFESVTIDTAKFALVVKAQGKVVLDALGPGGVELGRGIVIEALNVTLQGITVRNALPNATDDGVGILVQGANARLLKCAIRGCNFAVDLRASNALVSKCALAANGTAIRIDGASGATIDRCVVRGTDQAVELVAGVGVLIDRLDMHAGDGPAIDTANTGCEGLVVRDSRFVAISEVAARAASANALFLGNKVAQCGGGFQIEADDCVVRANAIEATTNFAVAIEVLGATGTVVEDNTIRDAAVDAIELEPTSSNATLRGNVVLRCGADGGIAYSVAGSGHLIEDERVTFSGGDAFHIDGANHVLRTCRAFDSAIDGFDLGATATNVSLDACEARRSTAEGIENSGASTSLVNCIALENRIDFANDGTLATTSVTFTTGGAATPPQID